MNSENAPAPGSPFIIEQATWRDVNQLRTLEKVCFPKDAWPLWDLVGILTLPNVIRLKMVQESSMIGFVGVDLRPSDRVAWIATIGILPEYQGQGLGARLLAAAENEIKLPRVRLCVRTTNAVAIHLYEKFGYAHVATWPRYYNDGESALVMEKVLPSKDQ